MALLLGIIIGIIALTFLVVVHELGHGIVARRKGVIVEEFGLGFPPRAWGRKLKKTILGKNVLFSVNWLPLGGFVKMQGEYDASTKKGDYGAASFWAKTKILLAGVFINWVTAAVLLTVLAITGMPQVLDNQFKVVSDTKTIVEPVQLSKLSVGYPAEQAGLKTRDEILKFAGEQVSTTQGLVDLTHKYAGKNVEVVYKRDGKENKAKVQLKSTGSVLLGAGLGQSSVTHATWSAPIVGVVTTGQLTWETLRGLGSLIGNLYGGVTSQFSGDASVRKAGSAEASAVGDSVAGPIGILGVIFPAASSAGITQLTMLVAIISISLATMNVLPIPALDGGRWFTMAIFRLLRKTLTKEREEKIQATGFLTLMALVVLVTIADVGKFLK